MRKRATLPYKRFCFAVGVIVAVVSFCGCSMVLPHVGELRIEPIGHVIYTYPVPAVFVTNSTLPSASQMRLRPPDVHQRLDVVAVWTKQL